VISGVVYTPTNETLDQYECSHVAHGDDIALDENGRDCYYEIRQRDRLLYFNFLYLIKEL
jgi:ethanolamine-phosphate cytidylyltransferase